jgi:hypothetical protein
MTCNSDRPFDGLVKETSIKAADSPSVDAFGRWRSSNPHTIFDSKQIFGSDTGLFWEESLESGADISGTFYSNTSSTVITSTDNTAGKYTRQTYMRFNYQPGKAALVLMTGIINKSGGGEGVQRRIGYFDNNDGLFFEHNNDTMYIVRRTSTSGSPVDNIVSQSNWNCDKLDGSGPSKVVVDWTKTQIFYIDFEWLGVGRVRFGVVVDGKIYIVHELLNTNALTTVYMKTPNLPLRFQVITTSSSPASSIETICASVMSEGGINPNGVVLYTSTGGTHVDATSENIIYAIIGMKLRSEYIGATVDILNVSILETAGSKQFEWLLLFNPTVAGTFTYATENPFHAIQTAKGVTANTVTGGLKVAGGFGTSTRTEGGTITSEIHSALRMGSSIAGVTDSMVLCVRPIGGASGLDVEGSITWWQLI